MERLLNDLVKEHRKVEEQQASAAEQPATITQLKKEPLRKDCAAYCASRRADVPNPKSERALEVSKFATGRICRGGPAPQVVVNKA
jgi:hypothetical protein